VEDAGKEQEGGDDRIQLGGVKDTYILNPSTSSAFLSSESYLQLSVNNIYGNFKVEISTVNNAMKHYAGRIRQILQRRLSKHTRNINDPTKHSCPNLLFTCDNFNCFVAHLCFFNQTKMSSSKSNSSSENFCLHQVPK